MNGAATAGGLLRSGRDHRWRTLDELVDLALDAPAGERLDLITGRCGDDRVLQDAALAWLEACDQDDAPSGGFLDPSALTAVALSVWDSAEEEDVRTSATDGSPLDADPPLVRAPGSRVGAWRLLAELGHGGMGIVHLAERDDAELPIRAALKFMHRFAAFDAVGVRRFRDERRILATLEHPAIARLLDGGVHDGVPWFAMEHVAGAPIDAWCDARGLPVDERLRLFCRVCEAVQHAHARLVVHRDLKPANILVSDAGNPKLLDFGIAKLLAATEDGDSARTRPGAGPLTPAYAAPEQLRGDPPSIASDVYALGVLLHVLLAGRLPRIGTRASDAASSPAGTPGRATSPESVALARGATAGRLARSLRGDLDTIVARAMHPDPARRYATADAFAADIRRHLDGQPVHARPDTFGYRLRKLLVRHPLGSAAGTAGTALIVGFAIVTGMQSAELRRQADVLRDERDKATEVTGFLTSVLSSADPYNASDRVPTLREVLDRGAQRADASLRDRPELRAHLLTAMAPAYFGLGDWTRAGDMAAEAVAIRRRTLPPSHPELGASLVYLANVRLNQRRGAEAEALAREALAIYRRPSDGSSPDTMGALSTLGAALQSEGRLAEAETVLRTLLAAERSRAGRTEEHAARLAGLTRNLAHVLRDRREYPAAVPLYAEAYALHVAAFGEEHPESANSAVNLGYAQFLAGDTVQAESLLRRGVAAKRRLLGIQHHDVAGDQLTLARVLLARGAGAEAERLRREAMQSLAADSIARAARR